MTKRDYEKQNKKKYNSHLWVVNDRDKWFTQQRPSWYDDDDYVLEENLPTIAIPLGFVVSTDRDEILINNNNNNRNGDEDGIYSDEEELPSSNYFSILNANENDSRNERKLNSNNRKNNNRNSNNNIENNNYSNLRYIGQEELESGKLHKSERIIFKVVLFEMETFAVRTIRIGLVKVNSLGVELHKNRLILLGNELRLKYTSCIFISSTKLFTEMEKRRYAGHEHQLYNLENVENYYFLATLMNGENTYVHLYINLKDFTISTIENSPSPITFLSLGLNNFYYCNIPLHITKFDLSKKDITKQESRVVLAVVAPSDSFGAANEHTFSCFSTLANGDVSLIWQEKFVGEYTTILRRKQRNREEEAVFVFVQDLAFFRWFYDERGSRKVEIPVFGLEQHLSSKHEEILGHCQVLDGVYLFLSRNATRTIDNDEEGEDAEDIVNFLEVSLKWVLLDLNCNTLIEVFPRVNTISRETNSLSATDYFTPVQYQRRVGRRSFMRYFGRAASCCVGPFVPDGSHDSFVFSVHNNNESSSHINFPKEVQLGSVSLSCHPMQIESNSYESTISASSSHTKRFGDLYSVNIYFKDQQEIAFNYEDYNETANSYLDSERQAKRANNIHSLSFTFQFSQYTRTMFWNSWTTSPFSDCCLINDFR